MAADQNACVTASIGSASLTSLGATPVVVTTEGSGAIGHIELGSTTDVTFRCARITSITMRSCASDDHRGFDSRWHPDVPGA